MRPIDAYALAVQIRDKVFHDFTDEFWGVMQCIREAPTVGAQRTGKWIPYGDDWSAQSGVRCSECGFTTENKLHRFIGRAFAFCPNCGAKMEYEEMDEADFDYERAVVEFQHDVLYEPTFNPEGGSV